MLAGKSTTGTRILELLKQEGGHLSIKQFCEALQLSPMAVHRQLNSLEGDGLVETQLERSGPGRPLKLYHLTEKGHEGFERTYDELANEMLVILRAMDGKDKINGILESRKARRLEKARQRVTGKTLEARIHSLTELLSQEGYMATWERIDKSRYRIKLMNCAVDRVARRFPQICLCEQDFIAQLLESRVSREYHILKKDHFCSYVVESSSGVRLEDE